jgi:hypothetical protein
MRTGLRRAGERGGNRRGDRSRIDVADNSTEILLFSNAGDAGNSERVVI